MGFSKNLGLHTVIEAEIYAIMLGLRIGQQIGLQKILIYSDSFDVINIFMRDCLTNYPLRDIIRETRDLLYRDWEVELHHTPRDNISCDDYMAKQGHGVAVDDAIVVLVPTIPTEGSATENPYTQNMSLLISELSGDSEEHLVQMIASFAHSLSHSKMRCLGYPVNLEFDYEALAPLLHFHINNAGDPFVGNSYTLNSVAFEVCVLDWFTRLWEIEKNQYWGYVTTGGTEGNLHGILLGREQLPDGILYASEESHYSVFKIARMCRIQCVKVATLRSGEIDCSDLKASLLAHEDKPAIINLNIGTTMMGAIDDLDLVVQTLEECGFSRNRFYIHCDGALFGLMLPFIKQAPKLSFKKPIGSIAISGHKFIGCPIPCGVVITRLEHMNAMSRDTEIIASRDATITGSRNGHAPIFLWYALKKKGLLGLKKEVDKCIRNADYLHNKLREAGIVSAMKNEFSNIVVFEKPQDDEFARRWSLACKGNMAHVVVMQHVTVEMLDSFVIEFLQERSFKHQINRHKNQTSLCIADEVGGKLHSF